VTEPKMGADDFITQTGATAADLDGLPREDLAPEGRGLTEDRLALEFSARHADALIYCHEWRQWLAWDGARWAEERTLDVFNRARRLCREASGRTTDRKLAAKIESAATVAAIVTLARVDRRHAVLGAHFDGDPWLLNTPSGTVDLRTGVRRDADRLDGITKVTAVAPSAAPPTRWLACFDTWTDGDGALVAFLQRLLGYCLTGSVREHVLPILHGAGGNGKTTFLETVRAVLGPDYVTNVAMETLIVTKGEQHPTDLADLRGKRLAVAMETEEGRYLAESKVKALTGGDRLRARYMRQDFFEFAPTHKLLIVGNHKPALRSVDEAVRRRLLLIPFEAVIPAEARDPDLMRALDAERSAILAWMIHGSLDWQRVGLAPPARVRAATDRYFESADALGRWLEDCVILGANETATKAAAFQSWKAWRRRRGSLSGRNGASRTGSRRCPVWTRGA
jgi:putative DNA primase/helicase